MCKIDSCWKNPYSKTNVVISAARLDIAHTPKKILSIMSAIICHSLAVVAWYSSLFQVSVFGFMPDLSSYFFIWSSLTPFMSQTESAFFIFVWSNKWLGSLIWTYGANVRISLRLVLCDIRASSVLEYRFSTTAPNSMTEAMLNIWNIM